jgi:hypothetical protein
MPSVFNLLPNPAKANKKRHHVTETAGKVTNCTLQRSFVRLELSIGVVTIIQDSQQSVVACIHNLPLLSLPTDSSTGPYDTSELLVMVVVKIGLVSHKEPRETIPTVVLLEGKAKASHTHLCKAQLHGT